MVALFRGDDALLTILASGRVMNLGAKSTQLSRRVNSMTLDIVCILVKEDDSWTPMGMDKASSGHQGRSVMADTPIPVTVA
jgi:hypothetical protein